LFSSSREKKAFKARQVKRGPPEKEGGSKGKEKVNWKGDDRLFSEGKVLRDLKRRETQGRELVRRGESEHRRERLIPVRQVGAKCSHNVLKGGSQSL